jgi:hypothetical protein
MDAAQAEIIKSYGKDSQNHEPLQIKERGSSRSA